MHPRLSEDDPRSAIGPALDDAVELDALVRAILTPCPQAVRLNTLGLAVPPDSLPFLSETVPWYPHSAYLCQPGTRPAGHPLFGAGAYYVQDAASLLAVALLDPRPGEIVCDLCASPGGKATAILERLGDAGWLLVNEPVRSRLPPLQFNLARHGSTRWLLSNLDPDRLADATGPMFDAVLVDAPCTAQSLAGREKHPRRAFDRKAIEHSAARQSRILRAAIRMLRPGGRLVYSTCTFSWDEDEAQVAAICEAFPALRPESLPVLAQYAACGANPACYRLWPHRHGCAGGFAARLTTTDAIAGAAEPVAGRQRPPLPRAGRDSQRSRRHGADRRASRLRETPAEWGRWLRPVSFDFRPDRAFAWPDEPPALLRAPAIAGPEVAHIKGRTWFPAYALAMRRDGAFEPCSRTEIDAAQARRFLVGESIPAAVVGWTVATHQGHPLGWARGDGRMLTNHLAKPARLAI